MKKESPYFYHETPFLGIVVPEMINPDLTTDYAYL
tara:strand:+ start:2358 stop:2462 length:105 start_codon:yes stop_codon:yes gene_type:complete